MKRGKIILGASAFILTVASAFALKTNSKVSNHLRLHGTVNGGACALANCWTLSTGTGSNCTTIGHRVATNLYSTSRCTTTPITIYTVISQ